MKATEFCRFFEFTLRKERGYDEEDGEYNYIATDDQGVFHPRCAMEVNDLIGMFESMEPDYITEGLEEDGFQYSPLEEGSYYEQALDWMEITGLDYYKDIVTALVTGELEDDTEERNYENV